MANILYGVNGEGAGHSTRAKEVLAHLAAQGHKLVVASFDRGLRNLQSDFEATEIFGFRFAYVNNRVRYKRTVAKNLLTVPQAAKSLAHLKHFVDERQIDLVITDFEPLTCHVGHKKGIPVISIDNQHCLTNAAVSYPKQYRRDAAAAKLVTRLMTPRAHAYLVISFFSTVAARDSRGQANRRGSRDCVCHIPGTGLGEAVAIGALPLRGLRVRTRRTRRQHPL